MASAAASNSLRSRAAGDRVDGDGVEARERRTAIEQHDGVAADPPPSSTDTSVAAFAFDIR